MLDQLIKTAILGLIQGLAEWLPISSTAHLKIAEHFLGLTTTPFFNLILHLGTLIVVVFYFRKDVYNILKALVHLDFKSEYGILIPLIIAATIPTAIIGLIYVETLENTLSNLSLQLLVIGITFLIGASYLFIARIGKERLQTISYRTAVIMGIAQGLAIFPGLSRSGATISTAILLGLKRDQAFKFSFLLSIPAIIGDTAVEAFHDRGQLAAAASSINTIDVLVAIVIAMIAGYVAIRIVSRAVRSKKFHYFALYTFLLGIALIILTLSGY
jgi:undecaprenyl-diphosphatase